MYTLCKNTSVLVRNGLPKLKCGWCSRKCSGKYGSTKIQQTWGIEKKSKGHDDKGGDDGEQDDQARVNSHAGNMLLLLLLLLVVLLLLLLLLLDSRMTKTESNLIPLESNYAKSPKILVSLVEGKSRGRWSVPHWSRLRPTFAWKPTHDSSQPDNWGNFSAIVSFFISCD